MHSLRFLGLAALVFTSAAFAQETAQPTNLFVDSHQEFKELLEALPEESLHAALHLHPKFRDGVYEKHRSAVEAVHQDDPPLATRLLAVAALDLIKRQNGTLPVSPTSKTTPVQPTTSNNPPPPQPPPPPSSSSSATQVIVPVTLSTTNSAGSPTVLTTSAVASASVSVAIPVTTTNSQGHQIVTSSTVAGAVLVSNGVTTTAPVPVITGTNPIDITTTNAQGSTFVTTFTPGGGEVSSLLLVTTTLPNGVRSTITSFAVVNPATATGGGGSSGPHLQSDASGSHTRSKVVTALIGTAIGLFLLI